MSAFFQILICPDQASIWSAKKSQSERLSVCQNNLMSGQLTVRCIIEYGYGVLRMPASLLRANNCD